MSSVNPQHKVRKRGNSILLRLTAMQVWRGIRMCFKINVIIALIALIGALFYINYRACRAINLMNLVNSYDLAENAIQLPSISRERVEEAVAEITAQVEIAAEWVQEAGSYITYPMQGTEQATDRAGQTASQVTEAIENSVTTILDRIGGQMSALPDIRSQAERENVAAAILGEAMGFTYYISDWVPDAVRISDQLTGRMNIPRGSMARIEWGDENGEYASWFRYVMVVPAEAPFYAFYSFDLIPVAVMVLTGLIILSAFELLMILFGIFGIRSSTRKILRPINELTAVAQIMNNSPVMTRQELKLSGTIDTLNAITEDHLDTRISIDDEREELKGLAAAINAMLDRLDAAYQAQLRFVSDASHELRTPISVIQGYANLLDRWGKRDERALQESIDAIKCEAEGMESLVEQLLFLARSDNNTLKTEMSDINISAIADEIVRETEMIDENHTITGNIAPELFAYGDGQLMKQAIRIFVDNAIKYTPEGGRIRIMARMENEQILVSVSDTGIGIAEKDISQVFERFFRADESRTRKTGGTGLGLSIAKWIIDRHGGHLEIVSRENIGTKITAMFPIKQAETGQPQKERIVEAPVFNRPKAV